MQKLREWEQYQSEPQPHKTNLWKEEKVKIEEKMKIRFGIPTVLQYNRIHFIETRLQNTIGTIIKIQTAWLQVDK